MIPNSDNTRFYPSFSLCEMLSRRKVPLLILLQYMGSRFNSHLKPAAMAVWVSTTTAKNVSVTRMCAVLSDSNGNKESCLIVLLYFCNDTNITEHRYNLSLPSQLSCFAPWTSSFFLSAIHSKPHRLS